MIKYYRNYNLKLPNRWKNTLFMYVDWFKINYACRNVSIAVNYILRATGFFRERRGTDFIESDPTRRYYKNRSRDQKIMTCFTVDNGSGVFQRSVHDNYVLLEKWKFRSTGNDTCSRLSKKISNCIFIQ